MSNLSTSPAAIALGPGWPTCRLPTELWTEVLRYLPKLDILSCLSVSRIFHDVSLPLLFSSVNVSFGAKLLVSHNEEEETDPDLIVSGEEEDTRTWEILDRIYADPTFASAIKTLRVYALAQTRLVFERRCLERALSKLTHVQAFAWIGSNPEMPEDIAESIAAYCTNLKSLYFEGCKAIRVFASTKRFTRLRSLTHRFRNAEENMSIEDVIVANSLRELSLDGIHGWETSVRSLGGLVSLDLAMTWFEDTIHPLSLGLILHHVSSLESLSLYGMVASSLSTVFPSFEEHHAALPRLHSLKLLSSDYHDISHIDVLCHFIEGRTSLRRLDLEIEAPWTCNTFLLAVIRQLPTLEVLGVCVGDLHSRNRIKETATNLPKTLTALRLSGLKNMTALDADASLPLWAELSEMPLLSFLYVHDVDWSPTSLMAYDIAPELPQLTTIGVDNRLWNIRRISVPSDDDPMGMNPGKLEQWSTRRIICRIADNQIIISIRLVISQIQ